MGNVQEKGALLDPGSELLETKQMGDLLELCVYQGTTRTLVVKTKYSISQLEQNHSQITQLLKLNELPRAIRLLGYEIVKEKHFCHTQNRLFLKFEIPSRNLVDFQRQISVLKDLTESALWLIIDDLIDFLLDLQIYGMSHGDLRPEYIYLTEMKSAVVLSPLVYTQFKNGYQAQLNSDTYYSILAPEQLPFYVH